MTLNASIWFSRRVQAFVGAGLVAGVCFLGVGSVFGATSLMLTVTGTDLNGSTSPNFPADQSGATGPLTASGTVGNGSFSSSVDYGSIVLSTSSSTSTDEPHSLINQGTWEDTLTITGGPNGQIGTVQFLFEITGALAAADSDGTDVGSAFGSADWFVSVSVDNGVGGSSSLNGTLQSNNGASGSSFGDFATSEMSIEFGTPFDLTAQLSANVIVEPDLSNEEFETASASLTDVTLTYKGLVVRNFDGDIISGPGVTGGSGFDWAAIPEPSRALMLGVGMASVFLRRRR